MRLIEFFVEYKRTTITFLVMILIYGYIAATNIPKESTPDIDIPMVYVLVTMDGISPEDSQRMIIKPLENKIRSIEGIKQMTGWAKEGSGALLVEFFAGTKSKTAVQDVRDKVNDAQSDLPKDSNRPIVKEISIDMFPVLNVVLSGYVPKRTLIEMSRDLKNKIETISNVLEVNVGGDLEDVIEILIQPAAMENHKLSLQLLQNIIAANNSLVTAGSLRSENGEYSVKVPSLITNFSELLNFPIRVDGESIIKVKDLAKVRRTYKDSKNLARINGKPSVVLEVSKRNGSNVIDTVKEIKDLVIAESEYWPEQINISFAQDESKNIEDMLLDLENNILLAAVLVIIVIMLSVGVKSALLISLSLPVSFFAGILALYLFGFTLNMMVLFSLILSIGMVVDDAIVVSEYADRKIIEGMESQEAYTNAASRMFWPIVTSTSVKLVVFAPLLFWPGIMGEFMKFMPITVIAILSNSLIFALFFQPSFGNVITHSKEEMNEDVKKSLLASENGNLDDVKGLTKIYTLLLIKILKRPKTFVFSVIGFMFGVYAFFFLFGTGIEFFPNVEPDQANIVVRSPGDLSLSQKDNLMKIVENKVLDMDKEIKVFYTKVGNLGFNSDTLYPPDTIGIIQLDFHDWRVRRKANVIIEDIKSRTQDIDGLNIQVVINRQGPTQGKPININITAKNYDNIAPFVGKIRSAMDVMGGFKDVEDSRPVPGIEWHFNVDRELAAKYGISATDVGNVLKLATNGYKVSSIRIDGVDDEVDVVVRFPQLFRSISDLESIKIVTQDNKIVPISIFVKKIAKQKVSTITRVDQSPVMIIKADVQDGFLVDSQVKKIQKWFVENYDPNIKIIFKGDAQNQKETATFLKAASISALLLMWLIMLLQFNTFYHTAIVMSAVFLSTVGVLLGLIISWQPFGVVMCGIGIIALAGIVLNNNILFIDTYNYLRKHGNTVEDSIIKTGMQRMRPILLTATTAVLGLFPMVIGLTIDFFNREILYNSPSSQWWKQLSASIAGGLTFSTILTLFFTPCLLMIFKKIDRRYDNK